MKDNEWISVGEKLPKVGQIVEVKFPTDHSKIKNTKLLKFGFGVYRGVLINNSGYLWDLTYCCEYCIPSYWRHIPEKRPDFSKLRKGDLIIIEKKSHSFAGYISDLSDGDLNTCKNNDLTDPTGYTLHREIKKITRINLETQKFEEI